MVLPRLPFSEHLVLGQMLYSISQQIDLFYLAITKSAVGIGKIAASAYSLAEQ